MRVYTAYVDVPSVNAYFHIPEDAEVIQAVWKTDGGVEHHRHICGLWLLVREPEG